MIHPTKRLELWFLGSLPALITALLTVAYLTSKHIEGMGHFMPLLPILPVFYWGMMQARDMPYWFVFSIGMVMDAVTGLPLGFTSLLFIIFLLMVHTQRKYFHKEAFVIKWGYFAIMLGAACITSWLVLAFFMQHGQPLLHAVLQWFLTVCFYPLLHKLFDGTYEYIHDRRWQILHGMR